MKRLTLILLLLAASTAVHAQLMAPAPQLLVPAAGSVQGSNGTFFHSDIAVYNYRDQNQLVAFRWIPRGVDGTSIAPKIMTINALSGIISEDFVASRLDQIGLGAILITALKQDSTPDPDARLVVTSRIWTPQPGSNGTTSQTFPTIATANINSSRVAILGQRISDQYRANVGIVNLTASPQTFDILQNSDDPTFAPVVQTVTLRPLSMDQISLLNTRATALQVRVIEKTPIDPRAWVTYGSSVDNVTGDSWSSLGVMVVQSP
jgi:hypothetical protein